MTVAEPLIHEGATTLSTPNSKFANLYDNIWNPSGIDLPILLAGRLEFPNKILGISHRETRDHMSDHIPVWMRLSPDANAAKYAKISVARGQNQFSKRAAQERGAARGAGQLQLDFFLLSHCPGFLKTGPKNRTGFNKQAEAERTGYRMARNC